MGNIYLFYGEEKYDLELRVSKIKKEFERLELGLNLFYINKENIEELENVVQGVTFFGTDKLVIIKDTKLKFNIDLIKELEKSIIVILIEDSVDKRTSEYKSLSKIAECVEFRYMDNRQMNTYIMQILKRNGLNVSADVVEYMQNICGQEKANNINEMQKLAIYLKKGDTVTKDIIDRVCAKTLNAKIFDVLSKIVNKDKKNAIIKLDELLQQKEPIVKIYIMLYRQLKQMYMIKCLKNRNITDIAKKLEIHPFVFKNLNISADRYSEDKLKQILYEFNDYDEKTKLGEMDFTIGLKKIISSM
ncbi:MAG: DNA polymerase III subunit delta [Clostridia bacterium]